VHGAGHLLRPAALRRRHAAPYAWGLEGDCLADGARYTCHYGELVQQQFLNDECLCAPISKTTLRPTTLAPTTVNPTPSPTIDFTHCAPSRDLESFGPCRKGGIATQCDSLSAALRLLRPLRVGGGQTRRWILVQVPMQQAGATTTVEFELDATEGCVDAVLTAEFTGMDLAAASEYTSVYVNGDWIADCSNGQDCSAAWHRCFKHLQLAPLGVLTPPGGTLEVRLDNTADVNICAYQMHANLTLFCHTGTPQPMSSPRPTTDAPTPRPTATQYPTSAPSFAAAPAQQRGRGLRSGAVEVGDMVPPFTCLPLCKLKNSREKRGGEGL